ncbi:Molybdate transporter 1 [Cyphellophora attinorum]|uniref:Molybdate transporter 1 n=1 Tax=Cyphellophora attinorum TaxID=1664694 RepID=A0A0N1NZ49_9EURO|nr:Molybdate transporter 1 [Phialophora attinorum]KPI40340.1 Molybdate transporter 1 [Phialophora attinorum]
MASGLRDHWRHNIATFRSQPLAEISGSLGDLGTFLPIVIALSSHNQISLSTTLILTGFYNVITGVLFSIPLPVQPMKAIAAVALLKNLSASEVAAAGLFVSLCVLILSLSGLLEWINNLTPIPIVKGIQVGAGLSLTIAAGTQATAHLTWLGPSWADNYFWLISIFVALTVITALVPRLPFALIVFVLGICFTIICILTTAEARLPTPSLWHPSTQVPSLSAFRGGILSAGLGQLPLTTLNSIIAVVHLASSLMPERPTPSATAIGISVASMNLIGCWFGAMPACHGSGGWPPNIVLERAPQFPISILTVMIIAAGLELASVGESLNTDKAKDLQQKDGSHSGQRVSLTDQQKQQRWTVMLVTAGVLVAFKNDGIGFIAGLICHWSQRLEAQVRRKRNKSDSARADDGERQPLLS